MSILAHQIFRVFTNENTFFLVVHLQNKSLVPSLVLFHEFEALISEKICRNKLIVLKTRIWDQILRDRILTSKRKNNYFEHQVL